MRIVRTLAASVLGVIVLAALIASDVPSPAATSEVGKALTAALTDPVAVLQLCGREQEGTRRLADDLARRQRQVEERETTLAARESDLADAETRLDTRLAELAAARASIEEQLATADEKRAERITALVKMVESNRASTIAPMIAQLEPGLAVEVLDRMNKTKAGKLLAALDAETAARLATRMTKPVAVKLK